MKTTNADHDASFFRAEQQTA